MQILLLILKILALILLLIIFLIVLLLLIPFKYILITTYDGNDLLIDLKYIVFHFVLNIHFKKPIKIISKLNCFTVVDIIKEKKNKNKNEKNVVKNDGDEKNKLKNSNFIKNLDIKKAVTESKADIITLFKRAKEYQFNMNSKEGKKVFVNSIIDFILDKVKKIWPKKAINVLKIILSELQKILPTFLPKDIDASLKIGFEDPFYIGIALAVLSPIYSIFGKKMNVLPSFRKEEISGTIKFSGKPVLIIPVISLIRLLLNKEFREFVFKKKS